MRSLGPLQTVPSDPVIKRLVEVYHAYESNNARSKWDERNPGNRAIFEERQRAIGELLGGHGFLPLSGRRVLEIGCGSGKVLASLLDFGAKPENLYGVDLLPSRIAEAKRRYPGFHYECANAEQLGFPSSYFGLVLLFTVFSSILDKQMAQNVADEVSRVLESGGAVLWYDFRYNNPRNHNVRGMKLSEVSQIFPNWRAYVRSITLLPPLARRMRGFTLALYPLLAGFPPLRTHYLGLFVKPSPKSDSTENSSSEGLSVV